jgi:phenylacetate-CoA ligase
VPTTPNQRRQLESLDRGALAELQIEKLNRLLTDVVPHNAFYAHKLSKLKRPLASLDELWTWPMTIKNELLPDGGGHLPRNLTFPADQYVRYHQTSGTRGEPMMVLDTAADWQWWIDTWQFVLDAADVTAADRAMLAFSFGPFIGFWSAFDALVDRGVMAVPGGGLSSIARLEMIRRTSANVLFATPTYALRLAEVAAEHHFNLAHLPIKKIIVAGEPGGSVPAIRARIEESWQAEVYDHAGASELGPWGYPDHQRRGLHVVESEFIAEFHSVDTGHAAKPGELAELVLTNVGRDGAPLIRYRTGDLVRPTWSDAGDNRFVLLEGGVLGRADDMMIIRGVNIFPSAIEQILHGFPEVVEYRITARRPEQLDELVIEVEDHLMQPERIADELRIKLGLAVDVRCVSAMSLPRFEGKGKRFVDLRHA